MKRFTTYLYEYNQGRKTKNAGFARIDVRGDVVNMEICVKNSVRTEVMGEVYAIVRKTNCMGINLGEVILKNGECNKKLSFSSSHIANSSYTLNDIIGLAIRFKNHGYLASCWQDEYADVIAREEFSVYIEEKAEDTIQAAEEVIDVEIYQEKIAESVPETKSISYKKIDAEQIRELPSANWHLSENSFLKHGVYNYGFLFLKQEMGEHGMQSWLGVPGYYEKQELLMALLFGFPEFEAVPKEIVDMEMNTEKHFSEIEKNQEPKTGVFGGWFVLLDK